MPIKPYGKLKLPFVDLYAAPPSRVYISPASLTMVWPGIAGYPRIGLRPFRVVVSVACVGNCEPPSTYTGPVTPKVVGYQVEIKKRNHWIPASTTSYLALADAYIDCYESDSCKPLVTMSYDYIYDLLNQQASISYVSNVTFDGIADKDEFLFNLLEPCKVDDPCDNTNDGGWFIRAKFEVSGISYDQDFDIMPLMTCLSGENDNILVRELAYYKASIIIYDFIKPLIPQSNVAIVYAVFRSAFLLNLTTVTVLGVTFSIKIFACPCKEGKICIPAVGCKDPVPPPPLPLPKPTPRPVLPPANPSSPPNTAPVVPYNSPIRLPPYTINYPPSLKPGNPTLITPFRGPIFDDNGGNGPITVIDYPPVTRNPGITSVIINPDGSVEIPPYSEDTSKPYVGQLYCVKTHIMAFTHTFGWRPAADFGGNFDNSFRTITGNSGSAPSANIWWPDYGCDASFKVIVDADPYRWDGFVIHHPTDSVIVEYSEPGSINYDLTARVLAADIGEGVRKSYVFMVSGAFKSIPGCGTKQFATFPAIFIIGADFFPPAIGTAGCGTANIPPNMESGIWNIQFLRRTCLNTSDQSVEDVITQYKSKEFLPSASGLFQISIKGVRGEPPAFSTNVSSDLFCDGATSDGISVSTRFDSKQLAVSGFRYAIKVYSCAFTPTGG